MASVPPASERIELDPPSGRLDAEDRRDAEDARAALREFRESGESARTLAEVKAALGLT